MFEGAELSLDSAEDNLLVRKDQVLGLVGIVQALQKMNLGIEDSLQELYERTQRLHQKIDRVEARLGSVPKK